MNVVYTLLALLVCYFAWRMLSNWLYNRAYQRALVCEEVEVAVNYAVNALNTTWDRGMSDEKVAGFSHMLRQVLAAHYASNNGDVPAFGYFYWRPHCYEVCPLLMSIFRRLEIYENQASMRFPHNTMIKINRGRVTAGGESQQVEIWPNDLRQVA